MAVEFLDVALSELTTLKVGGTAQRVVRVTTEAELVELVAECHNIGSPLLILGGGSNVVCSDSEFDGTVIVVATTGMQWSEDRVRVSAGEDWEEFIVDALDRGFGEFTPLSGIPGTVGATPIQNIGAYGVEISDLIESVSVLDRETLYQSEMQPDQCAFAYRSSIFKMQPDQYVVLAVTYRLTPTVEIEVKYPQLATVLNVSVGDRVPAAVVRDSVIKLRGSKSMVVDISDADSNSTGSFFINPTVERGVAPVGCPQYRLRSGDPREESHVKLSAAWLIENSGVTKGFTLHPEKSTIRVSRNHSLAIANLDSGSAEEVLELASHMRQKVFQHFGIELEVEPILVNCALSDLLR
jgi:UDP-N-acetylmuramate dehydrogenase